jgi:predicted permease
MGAGLFLQTLSNLQRVSLGYPRTKLLLVDLDMSGTGYSVSARLQMLNRVAEQIRAIPGVRAATWSDRGLFGKFNGSFPITVEGFTASNDDDHGSLGDSVGPDYFSTVGIPMLLGRDIGEQDRQNSPLVCVINEAFAKHFFAGRNPIGKHIKTVFFNDEGEGMGRLAMTVVGVAKNARVSSLRGTIEPKFYRAAAQAGSFSTVTFEIRTHGGPSGFIDAIRKAMLRVNEELAVKNTRTLEEALREQDAQPRLIARLCTIFAFFALVLAATGIYGVLSYGISRRTNEIGIRMALGAQKRNIIGLILRETSITITFGLLCGISATAVIARLLATQLYGGNPPGPRWSLARYEHVANATQLYGVSAMDPLTIAIAVVLLAMVALIAAYLPAARAARIEPASALRHE